MPHTIFDSLKQDVIDAVGAIITSPMPDQFWCDVKAFVADVANNQNLTSAEKHAKVSHDLKFIFVDDIFPVLEVFGETFIDVAIKLGVMYLTALNPLFGMAANEVSIPVEVALEADIAQKKAG